MNKENCDKLLKCILADDVTTFTELLNLTKNMNYCFGRFPVLSICYMYNAKKIIKKHEKTLILVQNYEKFDEPLWLYTDFRKFAKKSLRLYLSCESVVSPVEMLAILHKDWKVKKLYKYVYKDTTIVENVFKIYNDFYDQGVEKTTAGLKILKQPMSYYQYRIAKFSVVFCAAFLVVVLSLFFSADFVCGLGTFSRQKIYSGQQFLCAMNSGDTFVLQNDISLNVNNLVEKFSGQMDGNGKTVYVDCSSNVSGFLNQNDGTIENLNIVYKNIPESALIKSSQGLLCVQNNGSIKNVSVSFLNENGNDIGLTLQKQQGDDNYFVLFAVKNFGTIQDCTAETRIVANDSGQNGEAYIAGFVGDNFGSVLNCRFLNNSSIETTNIDVAGVSIKNMVNATIGGSKNYASLSQNCTIEQWSPTIGGIVCENAGVVTDCRNFGEIIAQSSIEYEEQSSAASLFLGGIAARNVSLIDFCKNTGDIKANCADYGAYVGGVVGYSMDSQLITTVQNCINDAVISVTIANDDIRKFVGGVAGFMVGTLSHSISVGTFTNGFDKEKNNFVGLMVGLMLYNIWGQLYVFDSERDFAYLAQEDVKYRVGCVIGNETHELIAGDDENLNAVLDSLSIMQSMASLDSIKSLEEWYE